MNNRHSIQTLPRQQRFGRKVLTALAVAAGATVVTFGTARRAMACWWDPIIFDPQAYARHGEQVTRLTQQVQAAAEQAHDQLRSLAHVDESVAPNLPAAITPLQRQLDASLYNTDHPDGQLNDRFPTDMTHVIWPQHQADQAHWIAQERDSLAENRQVQNQVFQEMESTRQQVRRIVDASNLALGETAAQQAHNDLLALASGELSKLQTLRIARSRLRTENRARQQSEQAFTAAERQRVRGDWDAPVPPSGQIADPFEH